jgi:hypothetical protein
MIIRVAGTTAAALALIAGTGAFSSQPAARQSHAQQIGARQASPRLTTYPMIPARPPAGQAPAFAVGNIPTAFANNWAGYAVARKGVKFRNVTATFFVPFLNCKASPGGSTGTFSSAWVGLDGFLTTSRTVEQDGISANCARNTSRPEYAAWYETFPHPEVQTRIVIHPGDSITATVTFSSRTSKYRMALTDNTNHHHFAVSQRCAVSVCKRSSAEFISEAPSLINGHTVTQASLADYGAESYASVAITSSTGQRGGIISRHWNPTRIVQIGISSGHVIAVPTTLHGSSFDNYWLGEI